MQQQISVITLGIADLDRSKRYYVDGFGWKPVFENDEVVFYQMNGFVFGTWLQGALAKDMQRAHSPSGGFSLAHNVQTKDEAETVIQQLISAGGRLLRSADAPVHGGFRGYVADPVGHAWEIAWNPAWPINASGHVTFGV